MKYGEDRLTMLIIVSCSLNSCDQYIKNKWPQWPVGYSESKFMMF